MPSIYLAIQSGSYLTTNLVRVYVQDVTISNSSLFKKYRHQPLSNHSTGNIWLYKGSYSVGSYATLQPQSDYYGTTLKYADVYYNRFDNKIPLVCVLYFNNNKTPRIYKNSEHASLINRNASSPIGGLSRFRQSDHQKELLELLIEENYNSLGAVTYELDRTHTDRGKSTYNLDNITISPKQQVAPNRTDDLNKYTHKTSHGRPQKSFLLFNNNVPMISPDRPVPNIQGDPYDAINVYYNVKERIPLMIELMNGNQRRHLHRFTTDGLRWSRNDISDSREDALLRYLKYTTKFVKEEKQKEQQKEIEKKRREQQEHDRVQKRKPGGKSPQGTRSTKDQEHLPTQTIQETQKPTSSTSREFQADQPSSPSIVTKSSLTGKICVLIDKQKQYLKSDVDTACKGADAGSKIQDVQPETISVKPSDLNATDYKYYTHDITPNPKYLRKNGDQDNEIEVNIYISNFKITFFNTSGLKQENLVYKPRILGDELKVYFYHNKSNPTETDTVPLMIHFDAKFYGPSKRDNYFTGWDEVKGIRDSGDTSGLKKKLDGIYNELNKIELTNTGEKTCLYGIPKLPGSEIKEFKTERIQVKVEQINSTTSKPLTSSSGDSCASPLICPKGPYVKYTHTTINKFKLGNIYYKNKQVKVIGDSESATANSNPITVKPTQNLVSVYYWINDTSLTYPLLIGIGKQNEAGGSNVQGEIDDYYKLVDTTTVNYKWQKLGEQETSGLPGTDTTKLLKLLNKINYEIKQVIKIYIDKQSGYELYLSKQPGQTENYTKENEKKIQVQPYDENECKKLSEQGYKCYVHKISKINGPDFDYNKVGGLKFYISGKNSGNDVEIPLHGEQGSKIEQLTYNTCMENIFVFFYMSEHVPLMLFYNNVFYEPENRDNYFTKWKQEKSLGNNKPCQNHDKIVINLNEVNKKLNKIDLDSEKITKKDYGLTPPENKQLSLEFKTERVTTTCQEGPSSTQKSSPTAVYKRVIHKTTNSFTIGDIHYGGKEIVANGVYVNGDGGAGKKIDVGSNRHSHKVFIQKNNTPNTVISYYSTTDNDFKLPQLIVLLQTDQPIEEGHLPITAKLNTEYGYYLLSSDRGGAGYKYKWRRPTDDEPKQLTINEETEFSLLNAIIILVDKQEQYTEGVIKKAAQSSGIKSPGKVDDVNRLKKKDINVANETRNGGTNYGRSGECVSQYGYKLYSHDITGLVESIPTIQPKIPLIGGLRFLISSSDKANSHQEITLYQTEKATGSVDRLYHTPKSKNKVYVFFYGLDPRPLLLCYEGNAYKPKKPTDPIPERQVIMEYSEWTRVTNITECTCMGSGLSQNDDNILNALLEVVCFLNPVQINPNQIPGNAKTQITKEPTKVPLLTSAEYNLHEYKKGSYVKMKITRTDICCYEKYTYEPAGTNGSSGKNGEGFRLGTVFYTGTHGGKPKGTLDYSELSPSSKYNPLIKVIVYYYQHDTKYLEPLLIELMFKFEWHFETSYKKYYYKLQPGSGTGTVIQWAKDEDARGAIGDGKDGDTQKLVSYLDKIRYLFKKVLQICIAIKQAGEYSAKLMDRTNDTPVKSQEEIKVPVSEEFGCQSLSNTGFRCFKHCISTLEANQLHKFAALEFYIPSLSRQLVNLNLYEPPKSDPVKPLYYNCGMGDIHVYFYGGNSTTGGEEKSEGDPRPLLLFYNKKGYRAWSIITYDSQIWLKFNEIKGCPCKTSDNKLLENLVKVCNFLNPVIINTITQGTYKIHKFNGEKITIQVSVKKAQNKFCYHQYTHTHLGIGNSPENGKGFRLGNIEYSNQCIQHESNPCVCITSVLDDPLNKHTPASEVVVYYYRGDKMYKNPLLVVLCKKADSVNNGVNTSSKCQPYYELQRSSSTSIKRYKKETNELKLDDHKGSKLEKILDKILFNISKRLQIILGKRLEPIQLCPIERKRIKYLKTDKPFKEFTYSQMGYQSLKDAIYVTANMAQPIIDQGIFSYKNSSYEYINENECKKRENKEWDPEIKTRIPVYKARVYDNTGKQELGPSGSTQIKVEKIECNDLLDKGYRCYRHILNSIEGIDDFGGLRLFLWDTRGTDEQDKSLDDCKVTEPNDSKKQCCEITLFDKGSQQLQHIAYTTCKGDLYVYFYGSDPRPLLLCYNGQAYRPEKLETYSEKWCRDTSVESCECSETGFKPSEKLLSTLYGVSMFLNPVWLSETIKAYKKVKRYIEVGKLCFEIIVQL